jgi:hypothetical protein
MVFGGGFSERAKAEKFGLERASFPIGGRKKAVSPTKLQVFYKATTRPFCPALGNLTLIF